MLNTHMAACLLATVVLAGPAAAQTPPAPSGATDRPTATGTGAPVSGSPAMLPGGAAGPAAGTAPASGAGEAGQGGQFLTRLQPDQIQASRLIGTTVVGQNNEAIGDVNDVIVERNGQAVALVIGVGGFLGIGQKDVAVPFGAVEFSGARQAGGSAATTGSTSASPQQDTASNRSTATTGNTGAGGTTAVANRGVPDRIMLRMSKADLQGAPSFQTERGGSGAGGSGSSAGGAASSSAPRP